METLHTVSLFYQDPKWYLPLNKVKIYIDFQIDLWPCFIFYQISLGMYQSISVIFSILDEVNGTQRKYWHT